MQGTALKMLQNVQLTVSLINNTHAKQLAHEMDCLCHMILVDHLTDSGVEYALRRADLVMKYVEDFYKYNGYCVSD